jgi:hypothetical protein
VAARIAATICDVNESVMNFTSWPRVSDSKAVLKKAA